MADFLVGAKTILGVAPQEAFQSNANHPLADSMVYIVNKFEHV